MQDRGVLKRLPAVPGMAFVSWLDGEPVFKQKVMKMFSAADEPLGFARVRVPMTLFPEQDLVAFTVEGALPPDIADGDLVLIDPRRRACDGDLAAVRLTNGRANARGLLLGRLRDNRTALELHPLRPWLLLHPAMHPLFEGVIVGIMRVRG